MKEENPSTESSVVVVLAATNVAMFVIVVTVSELTIVVELQLSKVDPLLENITHLLFEFAGGAVVVALRQDPMIVLMLESKFPNSFATNIQLADSATVLL
jgi:hypothetical protein